jgi:hypothetical protein
VAGHETGKPEKAEKRHPVLLNEQKRAAYSEAPPISRSGHSQGHSKQAVSAWPAALKKAGTLNPTITKVQAKQADYPACFLCSEGNAPALSMTEQASLVFRPLIMFAQEPTLR